MCKKTAIKYDWLTDLLMKNKNSAIKYIKNKNLFMLLSKKIREVINQKLFIKN